MATFSISPGIFDRLSAMLDACWKEPYRDQPVRTDASDRDFALHMLREAPDSFAHEMDVMAMMYGTYR